MPLPGSAVTSGRAGLMYYSVGSPAQLTNLYRGKILLV